MTAVVETGAFIDEAAIAQAMQAAATKDAGRVREILAKAAELHGLDMDEIAVLSSVSDPELLAELFTTARECKEAIYGQRLVLFAPLYISNLCNNDCLYCAFRVRNKKLKRRALTQDEIRHEVAPPIACPPVWSVLLIQPLPLIERAESESSRASLQ